MSIFSIFRNREVRKREERLRKARAEAPRIATMRLARGNVNLMLGRYVTQEEIEARIRGAAKTFREIKISRLQSTQA